MNFGLKRSYLQENPVNKLDPIELDRREVETFPIPEIRALLKVALEDDLQLLPLFVFGFFCGIRPSGELLKLRWSDVDLTDGVVTIRPEVSKTRRRRFIDIAQNARSWLHEYATRSGSVTGFVLPDFSESVSRLRRGKIQKKAGVKRWIDQGMRHTYCSNWLAVHHDINKLVLQSDHSNV